MQIIDNVNDITYCNNSMEHKLIWLKMTLWTQLTASFVSTDASNQDMILILWYGHILNLDRQLLMTASFVSIDAGNDTMMLMPAMIP